MVDACREAGVQLMEAFMYRLHPSWVAVRELVASGRIGEPAGRRQLVLVLQRRPGQHPQHSRVRRRGAVRHRLLLREPVADAVRCRAARRSRPPSVRDPAERGGHPDQRASWRSRRASPRSPARRGSSRTSGSTSTGRRAGSTIDIPFNIPPDCPTRIRVTAGRRSAGRPGRPRSLEFAAADPYAVRRPSASRRPSSIGVARRPCRPTDAVANLRVLERLFAAGEA